MVNPDHTTNKPVILLAFANDRDDTVGYLRNLPDEARRLREVLESAEQAGLCEVVVRTNSTAGDIFKVFQDAKYRNRIAIFHYGGHANGFQLLLETAEGKSAAADAGGLAAFLAQQQGLQLVFLNGCSTQQQTQGLLDANVSAVIATSRSIEDSVATDFACRFYQGLAGGATVRTAFHEAEAAVKTAKGGETRALYFGDPRDRKSPIDADRWPWNLYLREGSENAGQWNLPEAVNDPLFGLPPLPEQDLPASPYRHLAWFRREDAKIFFGRGHQIRELYDRLTAPRTAPIILFYGQSGVGKSSILDAGLIPRLEHDHDVRYLRRDIGGLLDTLQRAFLPEVSDAPVETAWRAKETKTKRPLIVFLDQVEELFTRPIAELPDELDQLLRVVKATFCNPSDRPQGKLVLSFRKEWLAELESHLAEYELPRTKVFLETLDRRGIIEVVQGPSRPGRLREHYGLTVADVLPEIIADDLLEDRGSAIAPTLQILLTKRWTKATEADYEHPHFRQDAYQQLKRDGILLRDFLNQQIVAFGERYPEAVASGLLLDILAFHTTPLGTSDQCSVEQLRQQYAHLSDILPALLQQCQDLHLLTIATSSEKESVKTTRLAHDTLAPMVREQFDQSDKPGQRARRILDNRSIDWEGDHLGTPLDRADLKVVEWGRKGTRNFSSSEQRLVKASRIARERATWWRKVWISIGAAAIAAIVGLAVFGWLARSNAITQQKIAENNMENMREALLGGFTRTIGASDLEVPPPDEQAALWELAELDSFNSVVRERLLDQWYQTKESERRALKYDAQGLRAATGTNATLRVYAASRALELAVRLLKESDKPDNRGWVLLDVATSFSVVAANMDQMDAETVAANYSDILVDELAPDHIYCLVTSKEFREGWGSVLAALATRMAPEDVARIATRLVDALEKLQDDESYVARYGSVLPSIGSALTGLASRLKSDDVKRIAVRLADAMEDAENTSPDRMSAMGNALAKLAALMGSEDAASVSARGAGVLAREIVNQHKTADYRLNDFATALAALAVSIDSKDAANLFDLFAKILENPQNERTMPKRNMALDCAVAALAARIDSKHATNLVERFAKALGNYQLFDVDRVDSLATALAALAATADGTDAASIADRLATVFESESDYGDNSSLNKALRAWGAKLRPDEAAALAQRLAEWIKAPQPERQSGPSWDLLTPLANRMNAKDASDLANRISKQQSGDSWYGLEDIMVALAGRMDPEDVASLADRLVDAMESAGTNDLSVASLGTVLVQLAARLDARDAAKNAERLARVLGNPQESNARYLSNLRISLEALSARMSPEDATRIAHSLVAVLEDLPDSDGLQMTSLGGVLAALATRMDSPDAGDVASRVTRVVITDLEHCQETFDRSDRFDSSVNVLSALAPRLAPEEATSNGARVANVLANELNPKKPCYLGESSLGGLAMLAIRLDATNTTTIVGLLARDVGNRPETSRVIVEDPGWALGAVSQVIPSARQTRFYALSHMLLGNDWKRERYDEYNDWEREKKREARNKIAKLCELLDSQDLAEVLKWPVCVGEAEQLVLEALENSFRLPERPVSFGGDIGKFVEQAESLGIKNLDAPTKRPHLEDVLNELETLCKGTHNDQ